MNEKVVFTKKKSSNYTGSNAVGISVVNYNAIKDIADMCDLKMSEVANRLIEYGLSHAKFQEDNE